MRRIRPPTLSSSVVPRYRPSATTLTTSSPHRPFTTTPKHQARLTSKPKTNPAFLLPPDAPPPPPYPYGPNRWYKQSNTGLYAGRSIQTGNHVGEHHAAIHHQSKARRVFRPNIQRKELFSRALGRKVRVKVSTRALRTMDKVGGLDEYLLGGGAGRVRELGEWGWRLRWAVLWSQTGRQKAAVDARLRRELEEMERFYEGRDEGKVDTKVEVAAPAAVQEAEVEEMFEQTRQERDFERVRHMVEQQARVPWYRRLFGGRA